jgi:hypothetical protein
MTGLDPLTALDLGGPPWYYEPTDHRPGLSDGIYQFQWTVAGSPPCQDDEVTATARQLAVFGREVGCASVDPAGIRTDGLGDSDQLTAASARRVAALLLAAANLRGTGAS